VRRRSGNACATIALSLGLGVAAFSAPALGAEFRVNTFTAGSQSAPNIARLANGGFVVVWGSFAQDGSGFGIYGQRYAASGAKVGPEFRVNATTANDQIGPAAAGLSGGGFVVAWTSKDQDGPGYGAYAQRFGANGAKVGPEFKVNTFSTGDQGDVAVAALLNNQFVITWSSRNQDGSGFGVYGQRYATSGARSGPEFRVNTFVPDDQGLSAIAQYGANGDFVVTWHSDEQDGDSRGVYAQRFHANGAKIGGEFRVNTLTRGTQNSPAVAALEGGGFAIAFGSEFRSSEVIVQRFSPTGVKVGPEFRANSFTQNDQSLPAVAATERGGFVVAWTSFLQDGARYGVYGQRFNATGGRVASEFRVNEVTAGDQALPSVAPWGNGFTIVWQSADQDGDGFGDAGKKYPQ